MQHLNENAIDQIASLYSDKKIIVFGCLVNLTKIKEKDNLILVSTSAIDNFSEIFNNFNTLESCQTNRLSQFVQYQDNVTNQDNFVQIAQGCSNNCSYCNIRLAKERIKSRPIKKIKEEVQKLIDKDVDEITLLADDCGSYGHDIHSNIAELLSALISVDNSLKIKIYTIFPKLLLEYYPELRPFFEDHRITYICAPLQSGSNKVLKLMNRKYDLDMIKKVFKEIKILSPSTYTYTHFMINFPGETLEDFQKSVELAKIFDSSMFIPYQENKRTPAYGINPKCTREELKRKIDLLNHYVSNNIINAVLVGL
jgi:tRNA A37 methylthiotransferase MiaB